MLISVVERQTYKRCRRRWELTTDTHQNLEPNTLSPALQLGGMVQEALSWWTEHPESNPIAVFAELSKNALAEMTRNYETRIGAAISPEELDPLYELIDLGMAMIKNYFEYYKTPLPKDYKAIQTEQRAIVNIPGTLHWECNVCGHMLDPRFSLPDYEGEEGPLCLKCETDARYIAQYHKLRGTMDSFVQDTRGRLLVLERKTYGQRPDPVKLSHDDQMLAYYWILMTLFGQENIGGILYDGLWKRATVPNSKTKGRPTTMDDMFYREIFVRPIEELKEFEAFLTLEALDMAETVMYDRIYINRTWQGCWDCGVERICSAMSRGEDVEYVRDTFYRQRAPNSILEDDE